MLPVTVKPVSAFVEPTLPPPSIPMLSSHVDLLSNSTVILCSREDLLYFLSSSLPSHSGTPQRLAPTIRASTPLPSASEVPRSSLPPSDDDDAASETSVLTELSDIHKIRKPEGEPGRPGRGGYTLETQLGWDNNEFSRLKVRCTSYGYGISHDI